MDLPLAPYLFHYTNRESAFEGILSSGRIRLSFYGNMNDPLENQPWRFAGQVGVGKPSPTAHVSDSYESEFHSEVLRIMRSAKLLALTAGHLADEMDIPPRWALAPLWDRYAERHKGVCLCFHQDLLTESINGSCESELGVRPYHKLVTYVPELPVARLLKLDRPAPSPGSATDDARKFVEDNNEDFFFRKTPDWQGEHEYRFVTTDPDHDYVAVDYGAALTTVLLGEQLPKWQLPGAIEASTLRGASVRRMDWSTGVPKHVAL